MGDIVVGQVVQFEMKGALVDVGGKASAFCELAMCLPSYLPDSTRSLFLVNCCSAQDSCLLIAHEQIDLENSH
jgi:hypothetical protein